MDVLFFCSRKRLKMACLFRRVAVGQRLHDLQGPSTSLRRKRMSYHGILLPANKERSLRVIRREWGVSAHSPRKNSPLPFLFSSLTYHWIAFPPFSLFSSIPQESLFQQTTEKTLVLYYRRASRRVNFFKTSLLLSSHLIEIESVRAVFWLIPRILKCQLFRFAIYSQIISEILISI